MSIKEKIQDYLGIKFILNWIRMVDSSVSNMEGKMSNLQTIYDIRMNSIEEAKQSMREKVAFQIEKLSICSSDKQAVKAMLESVLR